MFKRFVVEACMDYYPSGGLDDFKAAFHTREEAQEWINDKIESCEWLWDNYRIIDLHDTILFDKM